MSKKGYKLTKEHKDKIRIYKTGKSSTALGKHWKVKDTSKMGLYWKGKKRHEMTESVKKKISEWQINNPNKIFKNTSIELKVEAELKRRNINYQKQVPLCNIAIVDFYLPEYRIVIECDGDYWHNIEKVRIKDEEKTRVLIFNGFNVHRFWQHEINKSVKNCINKIWSMKKLS